MSEEIIEQQPEQRGYPGGWHHEDAVKEHAFSLELAYHIWHLVKDENLFVYDMGAGPGFYSSFLSNRDMAVQAFDAIQLPMLSLFPICKADLSKPLDWAGKADVVICLEVGEHIEHEFEQTVIDNICSLAKSKIIMSWAIPGQGGFGHVNCQPNEYIIEQVTGRGWAYNEQESAHLRGHCSGCSWFEKTLMVFDKK